MSDFAIGARLIASDGVTPVRNFHDHAAGVDLLGPILLPRFPARRGRIEWLGSHGDFGIGTPTRAPGQFVLPLLLTGATWGAIEALYAAIDADLWAEDEFYLELTLEGVTYLYRTEVPIADDLTVGAQELGESSGEARFTFICQPNPTVNITP